MAKASVSSVRQPARKTGLKHAARTRKITARISLTVAGSKPPGMSWGDFVEFLATKRNKDTPCSQSMTRNAAWAARSLDVLAADLADRFPVTESMSSEVVVNRLIGLFELVDHIAKIRSRLEEVYRAK